MAGTLRSPLDTLPSGPADPRLRSTWRLLAGSFTLLGLTGLAVLLANRPLGLIVLGSVAATGVAAVVHQRSVAQLATDRRAEAEHLARILQGLSRSANPDEIVEALVADLGSGTGADHVVVVRQRPDEGILEATLAGPRPGDPASTVRLVAVEPVALGGDVRSITPALEARVAAELALSNTLAVALEGDGGLIGAIVLARRGEAAWSAGSRRILQAAAIEATAALGRVDAHRSAEVRATTDALTGLPNRRYFDEFCGLLAVRRRVDDAVGILMVDIDHFKRINDRFGHDVGDEVLRAIGGAIGRAVREGDVPARFGGEEFVVLLRKPSGRTAVEVAERIRAAVGELDFRPIGAGPASVSVGVAVQDEPDEPMSDLLARADRALYRAKRNGRNRVETA